MNQKSFNRFLRSIKWEPNKLYSNKDELYADLCHTINLFEISNIPAFIAQTCYESAYFSKSEENLNYSAIALSKVFGKYFKTPAQCKKFAYKPKQIANVVYANRMGNTKQGDGWKYRGRGLIQLTGKNWYGRISRMLGVNAVEMPHILSNHPYCAYTAGYYWVYNDLDKVDCFKKLTKKINGGYTGLDKREKLFIKISKALS